MKSRRPIRKRKSPFHLSIVASTGKSYVPFLSKYLIQAHKILKPPLAELSVALVGHRRMAQLHEQFMGISGSTDVLTFELEYNASGKISAGEVVVCVPVALRESRRLGTRLKHELLLYALHGMLHLSGFDDKTRSGSAAMHRMEDDILTRLGIGRVFSPPSPHILSPSPRTRGEGRGEGSSRGTGILPVSIAARHGQDARATITQGGG